MFRILLIAGALALAAPASVLAQTSYYGSDGKYLGGSITNGAGTTYYGSDGAYRGQSTGPYYYGAPSNPPSTYYGADGRYLGQSTGR